MGYLTLKEFFKSGQYFLRLARSNKQTLQLYNISIYSYNKLKHLLSVSQMILKGNRVSLNNNGCSVYNHKNDLVATEVLVNGVYKVNLLKQEQLF
jgi:hypothetical protein